MDRAGLEKYLRSFYAFGGAGLSLPALRRALDAACLPAWRGGVARSWLESSISSEQPGAARFIHYYRAEEGLAPARRRLVWEAAYRRFPRLLAELNAAGGKFSLGKAAALRRALAGKLANYSAVIVGAEWLPGSAVCSKATVYFAAEQPLGAEITRGLARLAAGGAGWLREATSEMPGLFAADFYPDGRLRFKVYRRCLAAAAPLEGACLRLGGALRRAGGFVSVYLAYKRDEEKKRTYFDKAHFQLVNRLRPAPIAGAGGARAEKVLSLYKERAGGFTRLMCVNTDRAGKYFEVYFA